MRARIAVDDGEARQNGRVVDFEKLHYVARGGSWTNQRGSIQRRTSCLMRIAPGESGGRGSRRGSRDMKPNSAHDAALDDC